MPSTARDYLVLLQPWFKLRRQQGTWESLVRQISIVVDSQGRWANEEGNTEESMMWFNLGNALYAISWGSQTGRLSGEDELSLRKMTEAQFLRMLAKVSSEGGPVQTMLDGFKASLRKQLRRGSEELHTIEITCNDTALDALLPLLRELRMMGRAGASRSIKIEDWDGNHSFGFDGDGPDRIESIRVDGTKEASMLVEKSARRILARWEARGASRVYYGLLARPYFPRSTQPPGEDVLAEFRDMFQKGTPRAKRLPNSRVSVFAIVGYPKALSEEVVESYSLLEIPARVARAMAKDPWVDPYD